MWWHKQRKPCSLLGLVMAVAEQKLKVFYCGHAHIVAVDLRHARRIYKHYMGEAAERGSVKEVQQVRIGIDEDEQRDITAAEFSGFVGIGFHRDQD